MVIIDNCAMHVVKMKRCVQKCMIQKFQNCLKVADSLMIKIFKNGLNLMESDVCAECNVGC